MAHARHQAPPIQPPASRGFPWQQLLLGLLLALAAGLRCTTLSFQSLWLDEVYTVVEAGRPLSELLLALFRPSQAYPLYILGMRLWTELFGTGEAALRWPSALLGLGSVLLLYQLGRRLFGRSIGLLAAGLLALSPLAVWYSQEAKAYALSLFLVLATWLLLWQALEHPSRRAWCGFALLTIAALFSHRLISVLALIGQLAYALCAAGPRTATRPRRRRVVALLLVVLLLAMAGLWFALGWGGASRQFGSERRLADLLNTFSQFSLRLPWRSPLPGEGPDRRWWLLPFALAALAGLGVLLRRLRPHSPNQRRAMFLAAWLLVPSGAFYLLYLVRPFYHERYLLGTLPAYLLLLALGLVPLWRAGHRLARRRPLPALALQGLVLLVGLAMLGTSWRQVQDWSLSRRPSKEQFREATRTLQLQAHPDDLIIVHPSYIRPAVELYADRWPRVPLQLHTVPDLYTADYGFREFESDMTDLALGRRRAWLYLAPFHRYAQDPHNWVYEWFNLNPFTHCGEAHFNGLDLYCVTFNEAYKQGLPRPSIPLQAVFGQALLLWGADVEPFQTPLQPGDSLPLTFYLRSLRRNIPDLELAVQLVDESKHVWVETIRPPLAGHLPTSRWDPEDPFMGFSELLLPKTLPPGSYRLQVACRPLGDPQDWLALPDGRLAVGLGQVHVAKSGPESALTPPPPLSTMWRGEGVPSVAFERTRARRGRGEVCIPKGAPHDPT
ncbi:MAG: glycosyltransferase family 39 protein [Chloroflexia bacterium]|nr:glycosyltransferase family 39 protein [Chloroflexia bacterium]